MKHILNVGDRVQDSRNPRRKGEVIAVDIVDAYDDDGDRGQAVYGLDYAVDGCNGWSEEPYRIRWDDTGTWWTGSGFAEPDGWLNTPLEDAQDEVNEPVGEVPPSYEKNPAVKIIPFVENPDAPTIAELRAGIDVTNLFTDFTLSTPIVDAIDPDYYQFPGGAEVIDISRYLTGNGAQVVQYVARSTRLDGKNKGDQIENLKKARWFLDDEIARLEGSDD